jgi:hypothetical protein
LSFGGRTRLFSPVYHYLLALCSFFLPLLWLVKAVPNVFAAAVVFPIALLARDVTDRKSIALATALMAGLTPAFLLFGVNDATPLTLAVPLLFTTIFLFHRSRKTGKHADLLLIAIILMILVSMLGVIFLIALLIYLGVARLRGIKLIPKEVEILLFTLFLSAWLALVLYQKAFLAHGTAVIWQNIPVREIGAIFSRITLFEAIASTGLIALVLGAIGIYDGLLRTQRKSLIFLASLVATSLIMLWFKLLPVTLGLAILALALATAGGHGLFLLVTYVEKTKASRYSRTILVDTILVFLLVSAPFTLAGIKEETPSQADLETLSWARENLPKDAVILASPLEGDIITAIGRRADVLDGNYLLAPQAEERYDDAITAYRAFFTTDAVAIMQKYGATHLYVSDTALSFANISAPPTYLTDGSCFDLVKRADTVADGRFASLYERTCVIEGEGS